MENQNKMGEPLDEKYFKIHSLIHNKAPQLLRKVFLKLWQDYGQRQGQSQCKWENTTASGSAFIQGPGSVLYKTSQKIQKRLLESGNIEAWDLSLLTESIKSVNNYLNLVHPQGDFAKLKKIRNDLAHRGSTEFEDEDFERIWQTTTQILVRLGMTFDEIDQIDKMKVGATTVVILETEESKKAKIKVTELKEQGNKFFTQRQFWKAIKVYSEAVGVENVGPTELGILYSNRSVAFAELKFFSDAKDDAKYCINLRPNWGKGYYRLGYTYEKLEKFEKALMNYKISLKFDPDYKRCLDAKAYCVHILAKRKREEHLDPLKMPLTQHDLQENLRKLGIQTLPPHIEQGAQNFLLASGHPHSFCTEAHKYLIGNGYPQSYEKAAAFFAKAASKGHAEGLYNLAILTAEGKGVQRDMALSLRLQRRAAEMSPTEEFIPGSGKYTIRIGVMEAQHCLGLLYENGEIVDQEYRQAHTWYIKALRNGSGFSANNLGLMFRDGKGVSMDLNKAAGYWKVGALLGTVRAMESLAFHYFNCGQLDKAFEWYSFAVKHNSMNTHMRELFGNADPNPDFSIEEFENDLDEELQNNEEMKEFVNVKDYDYNPAGLERRREIRRKTLGMSTNGCADNKKQQILNHRKAVGERRSSNRKPADNVTKSTVPGKFVPAQSPDLIGLKPILFNEMDKSIKDKTYEGFAIKVSIVEDAVLGFTSICVLGEDKNGDVERIFVYNYPQRPATHGEIGYGCSFTIINPYLRLMSDGKWGIRIDDPNLLIKHPQMRLVDRCRFCGKDDGTIKCRHCKRASYCSSECRHKDSKELEHNLVCFKST